MARLDRFLAVIFALVILILAILSLALAAGWELPPEYQMGVLRDPNVRWGTGVVAVVFLVASLRLLLGGVSRPPETRALVQNTPLGDVRISVQALENLVERTTRQFRGITEVKPRVKCLPAGVYVALRVAVGPEVRLPALTSELQEKIVHNIEEAAGIQVLETRVLVDSISREARARVE